MIEYQFIETPYGKCLFAERVYQEGVKTVRKIVFLEFEQPELFMSAFDRLRKKYEQEGLVEAKPGGESLCGSVFRELFDVRKIRWEDLALAGTEFQRKVWKALFDVSFGEIISYSQLAERAGYGNAVRAVASAVALNPISLIIPCHRIVRKEVFSIPKGKMIADYGNYRWGREMKRQLIEWEKGIRSEKG